MEYCQYIIFVHFQKRIIKNIDEYLQIIRKRYVNNRNQNILDRVINIRYRNPRV